MDEESDRVLFFVLLKIRNRVLNNAKVFLCSINFRRTKRADLLPICPLIQPSYVDVVRQERPPSSYPPTKYRWRRPVGPRPPVFPTVQARYRVLTGAEEGASGRAVCPLSARRAPSPQAVAFWLFCAGSGAEKATGPPDGTVAHQRSFRRY